MTRQADWQKRMREAGRCVNCGQPAAVNPKTGKAYRLCDLHRPADREKSQRKYQRRKMRRHAAFIAK